ncbi:MAG: hypothetical protein ABI433_21195, partial [Burkholderiaceae bacterium]
MRESCARLQFLSIQKYQAPNHQELRPEGLSALRVCRAQVDGPVAEEGVAAVASGPPFNAR